MAELTDGTFVGIDGRRHWSLSIDELDEWMAHDSLTVEEREYEASKHR